MLANVNRQVITEKEKFVVPADIVDSIGFICACAKCVNRNWKSFSLRQESETTVGASPKKSS